MQCLSPKHDGTSLNRKRETDAITSHNSLGKKNNLVGESEIALEKQCAVAEGPGGEGLGTRQPESSLPIPEGPRSHCRPQASLRAGDAP